MQTTYQSWFDRGASDYYAGKVLDDNPSHILGSDQYNGWRDGWRKSRKNEQILNQYYRKDDV